MQKNSSGKKGANDMPAKRNIQNFMLISYILSIFLKTATPYSNFKNAPSVSGVSDTSYKVCFEFILMLRYFRVFKAQRMVWNKKRRHGYIRIYKFCKNRKIFLIFQEFFGHFWASIGAFSTRISFERFSAPFYSIRYTLDSKRRQELLSNCIREKGAPDKYS